MIKMNNSRGARIVSLALGKGNVRKVENDGLMSMVSASDDNDTNERSIFVNNKTTQEWIDNSNFKLRPDDFDKENATSVGNKEKIINEISVKNDSLGGGVNTVNNKERNIDIYSFKDDSERSDKNTENKRENNKEPKVTYSYKDASNGTDDNIEKKKPNINIYSLKDNSIYSVEHTENNKVRDTKISKSRDGHIEDRIQDTDIHSFNDDREGTDQNAECSTSYVVSSKSSKSKYNNDDDADMSKSSNSGCDVDTDQDFTIDLESNSKSSVTCQSNSIDLIPPISISREALFANRPDLSRDGHIEDRIQDTDIHSLNDDREGTDQNAECSTSYVVSSKSSKSIYNNDDADMSKSSKSECDVDTDEDFTIDLESNSKSSVTCQSNSIDLIPPISISREALFANRPDLSRDGHIEDRIQDTDIHSLNDDREGTDQNAECSTSYVVSSKSSKSIYNNDDADMSKSSKSECDVDTDEDFTIDLESNSKSSVTCHSNSIDLISPISISGEAVFPNRPDLEPLSERIKKQRTERKKNIYCKFCQEDVLSKNFVRHLERNHEHEPEVVKILNLPKNSKGRKLAFSVLRNDTNFDRYISINEIRPVRKPSPSNAQNKEYYPCAYCKGLFVRSYLKRHAKKCVLQKRWIPGQNHISNSQTLVACALDPSKVISRLNVKEQVFKIMKADDIAFEAKKDVLIANFGESYLKKHRRERMAYACSNRMRELSRLLINYRKLTNENAKFQDLLDPKKFDCVIAAVRITVGYDHSRKTFKAPSLAMHLGTSLKLVCDELTQLMLKESEGFRCQSPEDLSLRLQNIKHFRKLIEARWSIELASLANKDLQEKKWNKPLLLPLVRDIKKFKDEVMKIANGCREKFITNEDDAQTYKLLVQCTLALLIIFNRRRIGDVQYLKILNYKNGTMSNYTDFENLLTNSEKMLTKKYRRVVNSGKGSRKVVILIPQVLEELLELLLQNRVKYISSKNEYMFATPGSTIEWGRGDVAIRMLTKKMNLENPEAITSNKLRKHIATVMQILNLSKDEEKQFSQFMGHTQKTHEEFYELPVDVYQTAKVSKLLMLMEKGSLPIEYKGKTLAEIDIQYAEDNDKDTDGEDTKSAADGGPSHSEVTITKQNARKEDSDAREVNRYNNTNSTQMEEPGKSEKDQNQRTNVEESSDSDEEYTYKRKRLLNRRKRWTTKEIKLIRITFHQFIKDKAYPSGEELKKFLADTGIDRTVGMLRSKIQHLIRKNYKE